MNTSGQREIVVEIERVQLIRKRTKTKLLFCARCRKETDFISVSEAAALFITDTDRILHFISVNECHAQIQANGCACICLTALLDTVRKKVGGSRIKLIGDRLKMIKVIRNFRLNISLLILAFVAIGTAHAQNADPGNLRPPDVPEKIKVDEGNKVFFVGRAVGTQNYVCKASGSGFKFVLFTPQATLFGADDDRQLIHHFFSPNPFELNTDPTVVTPALGTPGLIRATWQHSRDSSRVWAFATPDTTLTSTESTLVEQGAVAWLKLIVSGTQDGPTGGHTLSDTTFVQRLNTHGGVAPSTGCASAADVGNEAFVPYTADYFFYEKDPSQAGLSH